MQCLLDTGILLRLVHRSDPQHQRVRDAVRQLRTVGTILCTSARNIAEFWNVCTRPATARGGYGFSIIQTERRLRLIEWMLASICPDSPSAYAEWRALVSQHGVMGVQVHDVRLVALMRVRGIEHILTLNPADFSRYGGLVVLTPDRVVGTH